LAYGLFLRVMLEVLPRGADAEMLPAWEINMIGMLRSSKRIAGYLLNLLTRNPDFMRAVLVDSPSAESRIHLVNAVIVAIRGLEKEESDDMLNASYDDIDREAKCLTQSLQGFTKTDVWCSARLENSMIHPSYIPLFMKMTMDLWYYAATAVKSYSCQLFFVLFLEFVKLGSAERRLLCDTLAYFNKATSLLCHRIPAAPKALPSFTASIAEAEDEPDEKDVIPNSGFADLYNIRDKEKPKAELNPFVTKSLIRDVDMIYLLESLTVIIQNARLPPFEAPDPIPAAGSSKKNSKKSDKSEKAKAADTTKAKAADSSAPAAAQPAQAVKPSGSSDTEVHSDQLALVISEVLPDFIQKNVGSYFVKQFVRELAIVNTTLFHC